MATSVDAGGAFSICNICSFVVYSLLLTVFFKWIIARRKLYALSWQLPGPMALPFIGNVCPKIQSVPRVLKRFEDESNKYSSPYRLWYGSKLVLVFTDPNQIKSVLTECYIPAKPGMYYYWAEGLGTGLLTGHGGGTWRRNRLLMNAAFENFSLKSYQNVVNKFSKLMVSKMSKLIGEGVIDLDFISQRLCFDIVSEGLLKEENLRFQEDNVDHFMKRFQMASSFSQQRATTCWLQCNTLYYYSECYSFAWKNKCVLNNIARVIYKQRKEEFLAAKAASKNINEEVEVLKTPIDIMLEAQYTGNRPFDEEVIDEILNLYQAGTGPTSACISFFLLMLSIHGDIQDRLYNEISSICQRKKSFDVTMEDLNQFIYLDICMNEVMRMFPGTAFIAREVTEDIQMDDGLNLPPGVKILIPSYMLNMSPRYWREPTTFNPDRFNPANDAERSPYLFLPFGAGPRNCIGQQLGTNIVKTAIIHLLSKFRFHSDVALKDLSLFVDMVTVKSENGYPVQISLRE